MNEHDFIIFARKKDGIDVLENNTELGHMELHLKRQFWDMYMEEHYVDFWESIA